MISLRDLDCLTALTRQKHFARAAEECGLSQPAFSMRIRNLEERLGVQIVKRGNRFQGLTAEGEAVVAHARTILDQVRALEDEVRAGQGDVVGTLKLGVVPTATTFAARATADLRARHPGIRARIETANSLTIQQGVDDGRFDAGLTYADGASTDLLKVEEHFTEAYVLLVPDALAPASLAMTWAEAAELPLILLEPGMQNRRILDQVFEEAGRLPAIVAETSGFVAAIAMTLGGVGASVLPKALVETLGPLEGARVVELTDPLVEKPIALVTPRRSRGIAVVEALREVLAAQAR